MGNLNSKFVPDTSKVVLSAADISADIRLAVIWIFVLYACAAVFCTCLLIDRWRGPLDKHKVETASVVGAMLLSTAWPVIALYILSMG